MPETRRRDFVDLVGAAAARTVQGAGSGGGLVPTESRLAAMGRSGGAPRSSGLSSVIFDAPGPLSAITYLYSSPWPPPQSTRLVGCFAALFVAAVDTPVVFSFRIGLTPIVTCEIPVGETGQAFLFDLTITDPLVWSLDTVDATAAGLCVRLDIV
jgi:hypothetical protein